MISAGASRPRMAEGHADDFPTYRLRPEAAVRNLEDRRGARTTLSHFDDSSDDEPDLEDAQDVQDSASSSHPHIPLHPIRSMQEAFAESLEEATMPGQNLKPKLRVKNAKQRRDELLDQDRSEGPPNRLWRFRPGQRCHELRKLLAQISYGVELLIKGMANSNTQVVTILQDHIDEVDEFFEAAMEDVKEATTDLKERLDLLKIPLQNMDVFEEMLENRAFRLQIVEGNVKIEHILARTSTAHTQTIRDVSEGLWGVKQFAKYLQDNERGSWRLDRPDAVDVFEAMKGNTEGWHSAFTTLESNSTLLSGLLVQLSSLVVDIDKKAGEVSRRTRFTMEPYSGSDGRSVPLSPDTLSQATPPPSPPTLRREAPPRIRTMLYEDSPIGSFLQFPATSGGLEPPTRSTQRITKDSDTLRDTMLANHVYSPPESSTSLKESAIQQEPQVDEDSESPSIAQSETSEETESSNATDHDDDNLLYLLQPRTYTPTPPAPLPSPRVSDAPTSTECSTERLFIPDRASPNELSIHIEAEEDGPEEEQAEVRAASVDDIRETILAVPTRNLKRSATTTVRAKPLQVQTIQVKPHSLRTRSSNPPERPLRTSDREGVLGHKNSTLLRDRVSMKGDVPKAIHVPPVNAHEFQRPNFTTPQGSPRSQRATNSSRGPEMQRHSEAVRRHHTNHEFPDPPSFPNLLPSPASERQHYHPVQASPHSPLQQRPHTASGPAQHVRQQQHARGQRHLVPSQMGMSTLSRTMTTSASVTDRTASRTDSRTEGARTIKKKRSAFGWLKKAFSLDEEERAAFEARKRAIPVTYYQSYGAPGEVQSPRFIDGKRVA